MAAEGRYRTMLVAAIPRVNGAATGWPRKAAYDTWLQISKTARQWGRDRMAAEGALRNDPAAPARGASMGPRPDGRGRATGTTTWQWRSWASMGPRPDGRGRCRGPRGSCRRTSRQWGRDRMAAEGCAAGCVPGCSWCVNGAATGWPRKACPSCGIILFLVPASMGPRPDGRGRRTRGVLTMHAFLRQWGRDRMAAEGKRAHGGPIGPPCVNGAATGWPRKGLCPPQCPCRPSASMGPRPDGRGRVNALSEIVQHLVRQWGRDRMAAEGVEAYVDSVRRDLRQWGRDRMAAEGSQAVDLYCGVPERQWGRDRMAAEGGLTWQRATREWCVNGAATGWPRKELPAEHPGPAGQASMGPRPDGRGRLRGGPGQHGANCASMGPRPDGRGRARARRNSYIVLLRQWGRDRMAAEGFPVRPWSGRGTSVNGAATGWPRKARMCGRAARRVTGVNGAATGWPRKGRSPISLSLHSFCVNGAATGWPRKAVSFFSTIVTSPSGVNGAATGWPRKGVGRIGHV